MPTDWASKFAAFLSHKHHTTQDGRAPAASGAKAAFACDGLAELYTNPLLTVHRRSLMCLPILADAASDDDTEGGDGVDGTDSERGRKGTDAAFLTRTLQRASTSGLAFEASSEHVTMQNPLIEDHLQRILKTIRTKFGIDAGVTTITAEFEKFVFFPATGSRVANKADGAQVSATTAAAVPTGNVFGRLMIALPSDCEGGELVLRTPGGTKTTYFVDNTLSKCVAQYAAWYTECEYEVTPVTRGARCVLMFMLCCTGEVKPAAPSSENMSIFAAMLQNSAAKLKGAGRPTLVVGLANQYDEGTLCTTDSGGVASLEGADRQLVKELVRATKQCGSFFSTYLVKRVRTVDYYDLANDYTSYGGCYSAASWEKNSDKVEDSWFTLSGGAVSSEDSVWLPRLTDKDVQQAPGLSEIWPESWCEEEEEEEAAWEGPAKIETFEAWTFVVVDDRTKHFTVLTHGANASVTALRSLSPRSPEHGELLRSIVDTFHDDANLIQMLCDPSHPVLLPPVTEELALYSLERAAKSFVPGMTALLANYNPQAVLQSLTKAGCTASGWKALQTACRVLAAGSETAAFSTLLVDFVVEQCDRGDLGRFIKGELPQYPDSAERDTQCQKLVAFTLFKNSDACTSRLVQYLESRRTTTNRAAEDTFWRYCDAANAVMAALASPHSTAAQAAPAAAEPSLDAFVSAWSARFPHSIEIFKLIRSKHVEQLTLEYQKLAFPRKPTLVFLKSHVAVPSEVSNAADFRAFLARGTPNETFDAKCASYAAANRVSRVLSDDEFSSEPYGKQPSAICRVKKRPSASSAAMVSRFKSVKERFAELRIPLPPPPTSSAGASPPRKRALSPTTTTPHPGDSGGELVNNATVATAEHREEASGEGGAALQQRTSSLFEKAPNPPGLQRRRQPPAEPPKISQTPATPAAPQTPAADETGGASGNREDPIEL